MYVEWDGQATNGVYKVICLQPKINFSVNEVSHVFLLAPFSTELYLLQSSHLHLTNQNMKHISYVF